MKYAVVSDPSRFVALAGFRVPGMGKLFEKEILRVGKVEYKGNLLDVTAEQLDQMAVNFAAGICDIVQVPMVGDDNQHTEDPARNLGEVIGLTRRGDSLIATVDIRKDSAKSEVGTTLLGGSAMYALDYMDTRTGKTVGPTLLHLAITNRPRFTGLEPFRELVAASADTAVDDVGIFTTDETTEDKVPTREELIAALKTEHNIDVADLQAQLAKPPAAPAVDPALTQLSQLLVDKGIIKLAGDATEAKPSELVAAVTKVTTDNVALSGRIEKLESSAAEVEINGLIKEGRILPAQKDAFLKLSMTDRPTFEALVPKEPIVKLSEEGTDGPTELGSPFVKLSEDDQKEVDRYVARANGQKVSS